MRSTSRFGRGGLAILLMAGLAGCDSSPGAVPSHPAYAVARQLEVSVVPAVNGGTTVTFGWKGDNASSYVLEVGRVSGGSDVARLDVGPATAYSWSAVPLGTYYARIQPLNGSTLGTPSNEVTMTCPDARHIIDALVFARGPLAVPGNEAGPATADRMEAWSPGSAFRVILGDSVPQDVATSVERTLAQIGPATGGAVQGSLEGRAADPLPLPDPGEVMIAMGTPEDVKRECSCERCVGCAWHWLRGSAVQRGRVLLATPAQPATAAHELGHIIGLGHILSGPFMQPAFTMGITPEGYAPSQRVPVLEPATIRMLETIYSFGFTAGASRRDFQAAGLVAPDAVETAAIESPPSAGTGRGSLVREEGEERLVIQQVCQQAP